MNFKAHGRAFDAHLFQDAGMDFTKMRQLRLGPQLDGAGTPGVIPSRRARCDLHLIGGHTQCAKGCNCVGLGIEHINVALRIRPVANNCLTGTHSGRDQFLFRRAIAFKLGADFKQCAVIKTAGIIAPDGGQQVGQDRRAHHIKIA